MMQQMQPLLEVVRQMWGPEEEGIRRYCPGDRKQACPAYW